MYITFKRNEPVLTVSSENIRHYLFIVVLTSVYSRNIRNHSFERFEYNLRMFINHEGRPKSKVTTFRKSAYVLFYAIRFKCSSTLLYNHGRISLSLNVFTTWLARSWPSPRSRFVGFPLRNRPCDFRERPLFRFHRSVYSVLYLTVLRIRYRHSS